MLARALLITSILFGLAAAACGGDDDVDDHCADDWVEVSYLGGEDDGLTQCKQIPAACGGTARCDSDECRGALYGLCDSPYIGVACSDTVPPTIVSCNP